MPTNRHGLNKAEMSEEDIYNEGLRILAEWETQKTKSEKEVEEEKRLRKEVVSWLGCEDIAKGTENIPLGNGFKLKITKGINYNVNQTIVKMQLDEIAGKGPAEQLIAQRLMKWSAKLSITEYNLLEQELKTIINKCITTSDATPTIEIVAPKTDGRAVAKEGHSI